jgi:hypothetical protein
MIEKAKRADFGRTNWPPPANQRRPYIHTSQKEKHLQNFNYNKAAGVYSGKTFRSASAPRYKRFDTAAEAVQFAVEELSGAIQRGCVLEMDELRYNHTQIVELYEAAAFPLPRRIL